MSRLTGVLARAGGENAFVKVLATNQDNEKNQIYLSTDDSLLSLLPGTLGFLADSASTRKRHSAPGVGKEVLSMDFSWIHANGAEERAPKAKLIYYLQYPELRLSGFLTGAPSAPRSLRRDEQDDFGRRVLVLAVRRNEVLGTVVTDRDNAALVSELSELAPLPGQTILKSLPITRDEGSINLDRLLAELRSVAGEWHEACVLKSGDSVPHAKQALQGSGWTLEALLGIPMNGTKGPDKYGYEIKAVAGTGPVSLITSEPDFGWRKEHGLADSLSRFGWPGAKDDGSLRFNGRHDTVRPYPRSGAKLVIDHWDCEQNGPDGTGDPDVLLVHAATGEVIAGWRFTSLAEKWSKKHAGCVYVGYRRRPDSGLALDYSYGPQAWVGLGTSINHFLRALSSGAVYLDPGDRIDSGGATKARMQWRTAPARGVTLPERLSLLYVDFRDEVLTRSLLGDSFGSTLEDSND